MALIKMNDRAKREGCKRCGDTGPFYWGKDQDTNGYVLVDANDETREVKKGEFMAETNRHVCPPKGTVPAAPNGTDAEEQASHRYDPSEDDSMPAAAAAAAATGAPIPAPVPTVAASGDHADAMAQMFALMQQIMGAPKIDRAEIETIARDVIQGVVFPSQTVVVFDGESREVPGLTHKSLARAIAAVSVGQDILLVGPAGTGKSKMAQQVAEALLLNYYLPPSLTSQTGEAKFTGFVDATGNYHATEAYRWASNPNGGIYILDELDNGNPNVNGWWNSVLANREVVFPNGERFKLTPKHRVVATANTYGFGRTREFVGRNPIDTATKNRFAVLTIKIDEALEESLVRATGVASDTADKILAYVRSLRKASDSTGINVILSPRNSVGMASLLTNAYYDWDMAVEDRLIDGVDADTWRKLTDAAKS